MQIHDVNTFPTLVMPADMVGLSDKGLKTTEYIKMVLTHIYLSKSYEMKTVMLFLYINQFIERICQPGFNDYFLTWSLLVVRRPDVGLKLEGLNWKEDVKKPAPHICMQDLIRMTIFCTC